MTDSRRRLGVLIVLVSGLVFAGAGLGLLWWSLQLADKTALDQSAAESQCQKRLRSLGAVLRTENHLKLVVPKVSSPRVAMEDASALPAVCPGWRVTYFCLGVSCGEGSVVTMTVELEPIR